VFPLTPNSKSLLHVSNSPFNGTGPQTPSCSPQSEHGNPPHRTTQYEDQRLFDRLLGRPLDVDDSSGNINETVGVVSNIFINSDDLCHV
jgi:hypothetical protein